MCGCNIPISAMRNGGFDDLIGSATYQREGGDLAARGLYLDEQPWQAHAFIVTKSDFVPP